jgi:hypothetical protein
MRAIVGAQSGERRGGDAVDYIEAGSRGPLVVLVHASVSGARQWGRLIDDLQDPIANGTR